jgi:hypothetical protein
MIVDQNRIYDGTVSFAGGQDSGRNPVLINDDQYQYGENVICRSGELTTRPAFKFLSRNFTNNITYDDQGGHGGANPVGSQAAFQSGLFQGASYFDPSLDTEMFVVSIGGRLFQVVPRRTSIDITELYLPTQNRPSIQKAYMVQADRFHITQDGENAPIIFDGVTARRANKDEIFTGTIMAYGMGRIVLVGKNFRDIYFGDLYGSHTGEPGLSVLQFTETNFRSEGGAASLPFTMGHCKGLAFVPEQDTSMGQGQLFAFAEKGAASFFLNLERSQWKQSQFQVMALIEVGGRGHRAFTAVNGDIWFRAGDGWRTYRQARAEARGWFQLPLSTEVSNYVDVETPVLLEFTSSIHFNNRLIATATPIWNNGKPYHNGILSLDFDILSSFGQTQKPSWDGHWSGIKITQLVEGIFAGEHRAFAFGLDDDGFNCIYEIDFDSTSDTSGPIVSYVVPKSFTSQQYFNENTFIGADVWVDNVKENTTFEAWYKPDNYPSWLPWQTQDKYPLPTITPIGSVGQISNGTPTLREGFQPRFGLMRPDVGTDSSTGRDLKRAYEIHAKLQWTGYMSLNRFRISDLRMVEKSKRNQK